MDPVQFLKCILFFSLDRIIIYGNKLYDLRNLVGLPVWFVGPVFEKLRFQNFFGPQGNEATVFKFLRFEERF